MCVYKFQQQSIALSCVCHNSKSRFMMRSVESDDLIVDCLILVLDNTDG